MLNLLFLSLRGYSYKTPGIYLGFGISGVYYIILAIGNIISSNKAKKAYYYAYYLGNGAQQSQPPINNPQVGQTPVRPTYVNNDQQINHQFDDRQDWN